MEIGLNNPWFFNQFSGTFVPDKVVTAIKNTGVKVLRFAGGTIANYYTYKDINGVELPGYGYEKTSAKRNYVNMHIDMVNKIGCDTIYVANIFQALLNPTEENIEYRIREAVELVQLIPRCKYVEIGNEIAISGKFLLLPDKPGFYLDGFTPKYISEADYLRQLGEKTKLYLSITDRFIKAIRKVKPDIKFGLPFQPPFTLRNKEWNRLLRAYGGYDAEVQHIYLETKTFEATEAGIKTSIAGATKPIWITEWAWSHGNDADDNPKNLQDVGKDYYKRFFMEYPLICGNIKSPYQPINLICRHQAYANTVYGVIKPSDII